MITEFKQTTNVGTEAVKRLRLHKLHNGVPFMINSKELPGNQCYLEYPNGIIKLVKLLQGEMDFTVLQVLSPNESTEVRRKFHLA
jgi:hypothetical protein